MLALLAAVTSLASGVAGAIGRERAAGRQRNFARQMADDVIAQGEREAEFATMDLARLRGAQTTAIAAQGIDTTQGSAAQIAEQTERFGQEDINQIRMNATREAWGIRTQANLNYNAERNAAIAGGIGAVGRFAGDYNDYRTAQKAAAEADEERKRRMRGELGGGTLTTRPVDAWDVYRRSRVGLAGGR
jgi:hypothetical protein